MQRTAQNSLVILAAVGAAIAVVQTQTHWLSANNAPLERERCYGVTREAGNDCATPKHSCAAQATKSRDASEWIMLPKGVCDKLVGGISKVL